MDVKNRNLTHEHKEIFGAIVIEYFDMITFSYFWKYYKRKTWARIFHWHFHVIKNSEHILWRKCNCNIMVFNSVSVCSPEGYSKRANECNVSDCVCIQMYTRYKRVGECVYMRMHCASHYWIKRCTFEINQFYWFEYKLNDFN